MNSDRPGFELCSIPARSPETMAGRRAPVYGTAVLALVEPPSQNLQPAIVARRTGVTLVTTI
jgi:hypothetical protein